MFKMMYLIKCPKELQHVPSAPLWSYFKFSLSKASFNDKMKHYYQPLLDQHGVIRVFDAMGWSLLVGDAKIAKEISLKPKIFIKPIFENAPISEKVEQFFGVSQVASNNGEEWKRHRKIINPVFNKSWSTELFGNCVKDVISQWEKKNGQDVKIQDTIQRMTLDVLGKGLFDIDFRALKEPDSRLFHLWNNINDQVLEPIYQILPFFESIPYFKRPDLATQLNEYDELIENMIKLRKEEMQDSNQKPRDNLLNALIQSNELNEESKLTIEEIRDNIKIFILAGHDTTSYTLTSTIYYLARYPEIQVKLRQEILDALGHSKEVVIPSMDQLKNIPYIDMVNKESMRIMTTASQVEKEAAEDYTLSNGITVPKGTQIILHLWGIHHNSSVFTNPERFDPDRFKDSNSEQSRAWQPFVTGPRSCIGTAFSMMEQRVAIAMLLQKFEFSIKNNNPDYDNLRLHSYNMAYPNDLKITINIRQ